MTANKTYTMYYARNVRKSTFTFALIIDELFFIYLRHFRNCSRHVPIHSRHFDFLPDNSNLYGTLRPRHPNSKNVPDQCCPWTTKNELSLNWTGPCGSVQFRVKKPGSETTLFQTYPYRTIGVTFRIIPDTLIFYRTPRLQIFSTVNFYPSRVHRRCTRVYFCLRLNIIKSLSAPNKAFRLFLYVLVLSMGGLAILWVAWVSCGWPFGLSD